MTDRCPSHPKMPYEDCPACEANIARAELAAGEDRSDETDRAQERYERWLNRIGEG